MAKENKTPQKKPRFSAWWIYGLIAILLIGFQFFGGEGFSATRKTTTSELQEYLRNGDIEKIIIITNTNQAKVYLTEKHYKKTSTRMYLKNRYSQLPALYHSMCWIMGTFSYFKVIFLK